MAKKMYPGRASERSPRLQAQLSFGGEDLTNLKTSELHGLLKKQAKGKKDITGGSGNLVNIYNQQVKKLNTKYGTDFESLKMPKKKDFTSDFTYKQALQETYMKVQNFLLSPESGTQFYKDNISEMIKDIERTLKERQESGQTYREREKTEYFDEEGKKHTRSEYVDYHKEGEEPDEVVYESAKDFYRLVDYLHKLGTQATASDIAQCASQTIQEHTIISPAYTFEDLCKDAESKLKEIITDEYRQARSRFRNRRGQ